MRSPILIAAALMIASPAARARDAVEPFRLDGVVVEVATLYPLAAKDGAKVDQGKRKAGPHELVAARALVTAKGVYAFLETPENKKFLKDLKPGSPVHVEGKLLPSGRLLHIDALTAGKPDSAVDSELERYKAEAGEEVTLRGANKCQCGLEVAGLPHSCTLGHLHHLEATDGKIYQYLPYGDGRAAFLGEGTHFKNVEVEARAFPGNFLLVQKGKLR